MEPASVIDGRVVNIFNQPIGNVRIQVEMIEMQLGMNMVAIGNLDHEWKADAFAISDKNGYYRLRNLPMSWQKIQLRAEAQNYQSNRREFRNSKLGDTKVCNFQLIAAESDCFGN